MRIDFQTDLRNIFIYVLSKNANAAARHAIQKMTEFELVACYLNWRRRMITPQPRRLIESAKFAITKQNPGHAESLTTLLAKIQNGDNLIPHLSKRVLNVYTHRANPKPLRRRPDLDLLLNDWGIHHLHLSTEMDPKNPGFVKRDGPLMFAIFYPDRVYLIDILGHDDFENDHLFRVIVENWPNDGLAIKLKGILPGSAPTAQERSMGRSAGLAMMVNIGGHAYMPGLTGSLTSAGTSVSNTFEANEFINRIIETETACKNLDFVKKLYADAGLKCPSHPELRLASLVNGWGVVDGRTNDLLYRIRTS